jgi:hypothetical protein
MRICTCSSFHLKCAPCLLHFMKFLFFFQKWGLISEFHTWEALPVLFVLAILGIGSYFIAGSACTKIPLSMLTRPRHWLKLDLQLLCPRWLGSMILSISAYSFEPLHLTEEVIVFQPLLQILSLLHLPERCSSSQPLC